MSKKSSTNLIKESSAEQKPDLPYCCQPEFIYGGPFIVVPKEEPFINTVTPKNLQLQGTFKLSYAYFSLKDRLPVILTKVIDQVSRGGKGGDTTAFVAFVAKLKNELITNKPYSLFEEDSAEAKKWNEWISNQESKRYFNNIWLFTECYVYRKLREGCILCKMENVDIFEEQKNKSFHDNLEAMCVVAEKVTEMLAPTEDRDQKKADFSTLVKICLWANKCDLSLSLGEKATVEGKRDSKLPASFFVDPLQMILDNKDKLLVDDTGKAFDQLTTRADAITKALDGGGTEGAPEGAGAKPAPAPASTPAPAPAEGAEGEEGPPKISCPAKIVIPQTVNYDIVCDNAGYELFADLCFAHYLIAQNIVQKIRIHLKNMPWFVSDATIKDFYYVVDACCNASYSRTVEPEPKPAPPEGEEPPPPEAPRNITAEHLKQLGAQWKKYIDEGVFLLMAENYWTWPHCYKDMKKYDYNLYRKLQYTVGIMFKGDLNYRKLLGEKNWNPYSAFEPTLQGFIPAPILAVRTVKSEIVCALPKGKFDVLMKIDEKWRESGEYGVIHFCGKAEPLKVADRPCIDYGDKCFGVTCPEHKDF